jgi:hypothetical protein
VAHAHTIHARRPFPASMCCRPGSALPGAPLPAASPQPCGSALPDIAQKMRREDKELMREEAKHTLWERGDVVTQISGDKKATICKGVFLSGTVSSNLHSNETRSLWMMMRQPLVKSVSALNTQEQLELNHQGSSYQYTTLFVSNYKSLQLSCRVKAFHIWPKL